MGYFAVYHEVHETSFDLYGRKDILKSSEVLSILDKEDLCKDYISKKKNSIEVNRTDNSVTFDFYYYRPITIKPEEAHSLRFKKDTDEIFKRTNDIFGFGKEKK